MPRPRPSRQRSPPSSRACSSGVRPPPNLPSRGPPSPTRPEHRHARPSALTADMRVRLAMCNQGVVPIVLSHARALLTGTSAGRTAYLDADLRDVDTILGSAELRDTLDLSQPVALSLIAILHFVPDTDDPYRLVRRLVDALPAGSFLALSHGTADFNADATQQASRAYQSQGIAGQLRTREEIARFFDGLDLIDPGIQALHRWRPDDTSGDITDGQVSSYAAIGRVR
nr:MULTISPECIES: SAM-dependent methyltransferase [Frankia]